MIGRKNIEYISPNNSQTYSLRGPGPDQDQTYSLPSNMERGNPRTSRTEMEQTTAAPPGQQVLPGEGGAMCMKAKVGRAEEKRDNALTLRAS